VVLAKTGENLQGFGAIKSTVDMSAAAALKDIAAEDI
jgi:hypothetical protein